MFQLKNTARQKNTAHYKISSVLGNPRTLLIKISSVLNPGTQEHKQCSWNAQNFANFVMSSACSLTATEAQCLNTNRATWKARVDLEDRRYSVQITLSGGKGDSILVTLSGGGEGGYGQLIWTIHPGCVCPGGMVIPCGPYPPTSPVAKSGPA